MVGGLTAPNLQTYQEATVIKTVWSWQRGKRVSLRISHHDLPATFASQPQLYPAHVYENQSLVVGITHQCLSQPAIQLLCLCFPCFTQVPKRRQCLERLHHSSSLFTSNLNLVTLAMDFVAPPTTGGWWLVPCPPGFWTGPLTCLEANGMWIEVTKCGSQVPPCCTPLMGHDRSKSP